MIDASHSGKVIQTIGESREIIENLHAFQEKYQMLHKKIVKPRKRFYSEDEIILNSLSNNKLNKRQKALKKTEQKG
jgi:hypothetical protein